MIVREYYSTRKDGSIVMMVHSDEDKFWLFDGSQTASVFYELRDKPKEYTEVPKPDIKE